MDAITKMKAIRFDTLRAHPAFPIVLTAWLVILLGLAAYVLQGSLLYALMGAIAGGLLGRYLSQRVSGQAKTASEEAAPETEREKRIRRVLGPDDDADEDLVNDFPVEEGRVEEDPAEERVPLLAVKPQIPNHDLFDNEALFDDDFEDGFDNEPDYVHHDVDVLSQERPQFLSLEELEFGEEPIVEAESHAGSLDETYEEFHEPAPAHADDEPVAGADTPQPTPIEDTYVDPGAALAALRNGGEPETVATEPASEFGAPETSYAADLETHTLSDTVDANTSNTEAHNLQDELVSPVLPITPASAASPVAPTPEPGEHAAAKLRAQDLSQMSLVQMIERLAFALDDYREVRENKIEALGSHASHASDAAVAEALRNLPALTRAADVYATQGNAALAVSTREQAEATEVALRDALEKLQRLSGSA